MTDGLFKGLDVFSKMFKDLATGENDKSIKENMDDICETLEAEILKSDADEDTKKEMLKKLRKLNQNK